MTRSLATGSIPSLVLESERLIMRPLVAGDADPITALVNDWDVVRYTAMIPYPYQRQMAADFIQSQAGLDGGASFNLAMTRKADGQLIGCIGLIRGAGAETGELGYWLGKSFWSQGYASEAVARLIDFAFGDLGGHLGSVHVVPFAILFEA